MNRIPPLLAACCAAALLLAVLGADRLLPIAVSGAANSFLTLFAGIVLDAFPFLLIGVTLSALVQEFIPDAVVRRLVPQRTPAGLLFGGLLGLILPLCECGLVPLVRRLIGKGMPAYIGFVYLAAGPVINPVTIVSTWAAFPNRPSMVIARIALAFTVAAALGLLLRRSLRDNPLKAVASGGFSRPHDHAHAHSHHQHDEHNLKHTAVTQRYQPSLKLKHAFVHAVDEFADTGRYVLVGAFLAALLQSSLSASALGGLSAHPAAIHALAMCGAYLLSLCSSSDAFVAAAFAGSIGAGPLLAFLVFGPAVDLKNTLMLLAVFRKGVVFRFIGLAALLVWAGSLAAGVWFRF